MFKLNIASHYGFEGLLLLFQFILYFLEAAKQFLHFSPDLYRHFDTNWIASVLCFILFKAIFFLVFHISLPVS